MSVSAEFREFLIEQMLDFGPVTIKSMFGGAGVYRAGLMFALVADDVLYLKVDAANKSDFATERLPPFIYRAKGGKEMAMGYHRLPERCFDDAQEMTVWCHKAFGAATRAARAKPAKKKS